MVYQDRGRMCVYINSCFVCKPEHRRAQTQKQTHRTHTQNTYTQTGCLGWDCLGRLGSAGIGWVRILGRNRVGTLGQNRVGILGWNSGSEVGILGRTGSDWVGTGSELGRNWYLLQELNLDLILTIPMVHAQSHTRIKSRSIYLFKS